MSVSVKPGDINLKTVNVFHHPVKAKILNFNTYIYISYSQ